MKKSLASCGGWLLPFTPHRSTVLIGSAAVRQLYAVRQWRLHCRYLLQGLDYLVAEWSWFLACTPGGWPFVHPDQLSEAIASSWQFMRTRQPQRSQTVIQVSNPHNAVCAAQNTYLAISLCCSYASQAGCIQSACTLHPCIPPLKTMSDTYIGRGYPLYPFHLYCAQLVPAGLCRFFRGLCCVHTCSHGWPKQLTFS